MEDNKDDIEDIFRDRFSGQEAPVSPRVWDNIKKTLPNEEDKGSVGHVKKYFLYSVLGILFVGIVGWAISNSYRSKGEKEDRSKEESIASKNKVLENEKSEIEEERRIEGNGGVKNRKTKNNTVVNNSSRDNNGINSSNDNSVTNDQENKGDRNSNSKNIPSANTKGIAKSKNTGQQTLVITDAKNKNGNKIDKKNNSKNTSFNNVSSKNSKVDSKNEDNTLNKTVSRNNSSNEKKSDQNLTSNVSNSKNNSLDDKNNTSDKNKPDKNINPINADSENNVSKDTSPKNTNIADNSTNDNLQNGDSSILINGTKDKKEINSSDNLLSTTKKEDQKVSEENKQLSFETKTNKDTARSDQDKFFMITNTPTTSMEDSVKNILPDSTIAKIPDSTIADKKKEKKKTSIQSRLSVDLLLSPMLTGATTKATDPNYQSIVDSKNKQDRTLFNFSIGGMVNYSILPRISISTGIIYSGYSENNKFKNSMTHDSTFYQQHVKNGTMDTITKVDTITESITKKYAATKADHYNFLTLPVAVSYKIWDTRKFALSVTAGVKINMLLNGTTYIRNAANTDLIAITDNYNRVTLSYMASLAMEYKLTEKISLLAQPIVNFNMSSVYNKSFYLSQKPYSYGVNLGLRFRF